MKLRVLTIVLSLFLLNSLSLYVYFSFHPDPHRPTPGIDRLHTPPYPKVSLKPWPILPSYLPWTQSANVPYRSCEAFFGNGFTRRVDPLKPIKENRRNSGWFTCFYSETLRSSICEGGRIRMVPERIAMSRGGEKLESVIGRDEDDELPSFRDGAFEIQVTDGSRVGEQMVGLEFLDRYLRNGTIEMHTMRELVGSIRLVNDTDFVCSEWIKEPTVLVTRFEYANLFHAFTDWYTAYVSSRVTGLPNRPHLVFVDGHCESPLEETWAALFSSITYAKNFTGPVCFRHAILAPLGYEAPVFKGTYKHLYCWGASAYEVSRKPNHKTARLSEFGEMIRAAFGFTVDRHKMPKSASTGLNILFVRREDYVAHPRHSGKVEARLSNEPEVFESIKRWASNHSECKLTVIDGQFAHIPMKEQVRAVQDAAVIVGAHGAGLTHIVSATPETVILEIVGRYYNRPHFALIAIWKGLEYHAIKLEGSFADPSMVVNRLGDIVKSLGC